MAIESQNSAVSAFPKPAIGASLTRHSIARSRLLSIVLISHTHDNGVFKVGSHHLARQFSKMGHKVAHISTPVSLVHRLLRRGPSDRFVSAYRGMYVDAAGVRHFVPKTLIPAQWTSSRYLHHALETVDIPSPDIVYVDQPLMLTPALFALSATRIYRPTDLYLEGSARRLQALYTPMFDGVAATSDVVLDSLPVCPDQMRTVVPNGVDFERFHHVTESGRREGAVYVGALDHRFDWNIVCSLARKFPSTQFVIAGPNPVPPRDMPPNLQIVGSIPYEKVPAFLSRFSIGLLPLSNVAVNQGRSPMKLYEYLAAGLWVVARDVPSLQNFGSDDWLTYEGEHDAAEAFQAALGKISPNVSGVEKARLKDWSYKAQDLLAFAERVHSPSVAKND